MTLERVQQLSGRTLVVTMSTLAMFTGSAAMAAAATPPSADALDTWAQELSAGTGISQRALIAYGAAEVTLRGSRPGCNLSWATLAGIGHVESHHGRYGGARLTGDGRAEPEIIGLPLDGSPGVMLIDDSDDGDLDGDSEFDRAVGPMQFIPTTWDAFGADGDGDGEADPHDIDDAALAAGRYLCAGGRDLSDSGDMRAALFSYNRSAAYGELVLDIAGDLADGVAWSGPSDSDSGDDDSDDDDSDDDSDGGDDDGDDGGDD